MTDPAPTIAYASAVDEMPDDRLLRRIVAFCAIIYGALNILQNAAVVAMSQHWIGASTKAAFSLGDRFQIASAALGTLAEIIMLIGGIRLLRPSWIAVLLLRIASAGLIIFPLMGTIEFYFVRPGYWHQLSIPAMAIYLIIMQLNYLWFPVLILLLMLPALARRMVGPNV